MLKVFDATPLMGAVAPINHPEYGQSTATERRDWLVNTPVWPRVAAALGIGLELQVGGRAEYDDSPRIPGYVANGLEALAPVAASVRHWTLPGDKTDRRDRFNEAEAAGLTLYATIEDAMTFMRGDVVQRNAAFALNEDGTRAAILHNGLRARQLLDDDEAEAIARRDQGHVSDVS